MMNCQDCPWKKAFGRCGEPGSEWGDIYDMLLDLKVKMKRIHKEIDYKITELKQDDNKAEEVKQD
jgi:hypothetical protein